MAAKTAVQKVKHMPCFKHAGYLAVAMHPEVLHELMPKIKAALAPYSFEAIAFRGMSGALLAPSVALATKKTLIMVRKTKENTHSSHGLVEGDCAAKHYVIVDDCVDSGATAREIQQRIKAWSGAECIGVLEVHDIERDRYSGRLTQVEAGD